MVDKMKGEKSQLTKDIATLSVRLAESKHNYSMLQKENVCYCICNYICVIVHIFTQILISDRKVIFVLFQERYKNDMNLAIQLLQCKPDNFVSQKLDNVS